MCPFVVQGSYLRNTYSCTLIYIFTPFDILQLTILLLQDKNQDDDQLISMTEFSMFVFPESSSALEEERNRIQKLKEEVSFLAYLCIF